MDQSRSLWEITSKKYYIKKVLRSIGLFNIVKIVVRKIYRITKGY